jgi:hypothetical protein
MLGQDDKINKKVYNEELFTFLRLDCYKEVAI